MVIQKMKNRFSRNFQKIKILFFQMNFILRIQIKLDSFQQIQIIFLTNRKRLISPFSKRKTTFSFKKTTLPSSKIRKVDNVLWNKTFLHPFFLSIFRISSCLIHLNILGTIHLFEKRNLQNQTTCKRRILFLKKQLFWHFLLIIFNPKYPKLLLRNTYRSNTKFFFQFTKHLSICISIFEFQNKAKLQIFPTPMIYLNGTIRVHQTNPKPSSKICLKILKKTARSPASQKNFFIVQRNVHTRVCKYNSSKSTNSKQHQKSQSKQHRSGLPQTSTVQSS